jgi:hypothetical protein
MLPNLLGTMEQWWHFVNLGLQQKIFCKKHWNYTNKKHIKNKSFVFLHCWFLLKDVPRWANFWDDVKKTFNLKQLAPAKQVACAELKTLQPPMTYGDSSFKRP